MKQPFTPEGAANMLAALYNLSDPALKIEALAFTHDLKMWLSVHFELNSHQELYLQQLNESATEFYAQLGGFALINRLPITLDVAPLPTDPPKDDQGKIVYTLSSLNATANGEGGSVATGELTYCIRY